MADSNLLAALMGASAGKGTGLVDSLFGPTPYDVGQQRNQQDMSYAEKVARMGGFEQAKFGIGQGAAGMTRAGAGMMGMVDPLQQEAARREQAMSQGGMDMSPKGLMAKAQQLHAAGNYQDAMRFKMAAEAMADKEQERNLKLAQEAAAWKKAETDALPYAKPDLLKATPESVKAYVAGGMKDPSLLLAAEKTQYESMSQDEKNVYALLKMEGLVEGTPAWNARGKELMAKVMDKKTHINIPQINSPYNLDDKQQAALDLAMQEGRLNPDRVNSRSAKILANQFILNPKLDMVAGVGDARTRTSAQVKVGTQLSVLRPFVKMVDMNGEVLKTLADKAIVTNSALANRPINWIEQNIGDYPDMAEFIAQVKIFKDEAARVVSNPNLVGVLSDTARKEMEAVISGNMPLKSMKRVIERLQADSHNRISTMEDEYAGIRGGSVRAASPSTPSDTSAPSKPASLVDKIPGAKATVSNW